MPLNEETRSIYRSIAYPPAMCKIVPLLSFYKDYFGIR